MKLVRDRRGSTVPEFAVASGAVLMLLVATIDLGTLFAARHALARGLDKAARYAAVRAGLATTTTVVSTFRAAVVPALGAANANLVNVTVSFPTGNVVGGTVVVGASYAWKASSAAGMLPPLTLSAQQVLTILH